MAKALIVGNKEYKKLNDLLGGKRYAERLTKLLGLHHDEMPNMKCKMLVNNKKSRLTSYRLTKKTELLFNQNDDVLLFYFFGHAVKTTNDIYLQTLESDGEVMANPMKDLMKLISGCAARNVVVILDCCHAGGMADVELFRKRLFAQLPDGVSIIASAQADGQAFEPEGVSMFSDAICRTLEFGGDIIGNVRISDLILSVSKTLEEVWEQKPQFKLNYTDDVVLRRALPSVPARSLNQLCHYFPEKERWYHLGAIEDYESREVPEPIRKYLNYGLARECPGVDMGFANLFIPKAYELTEIGKEQWDLVYNQINSDE